jgi:hypothetical protein
VGEVSGKVIMIDVSIWCLASFCQSFVNELRQLWNTETEITGIAHGPELEIYVCGRKLVGDYTPTKPEQTLDGWQTTRRYRFTTVSKWTGDQQVPNLQAKLAAMPIEAWREAKVEAKVVRAREFFSNLQQ